MATLWRDAMLCKDAPLQGDGLLRHDLLLPSVMRTASSISRSSETGSGTGGLAPPCHATGGLAPPHPPSTEVGIGIRIDRQGVLGLLHLQRGPGGTAIKILAVSTGETGALLLLGVGGLMPVTRMIMLLATRCRRHRCRRPRVTVLTRAGSRTTAGRLGAMYMHLAATMVSGSAVIGRQDLRRIIARGMATRIRCLQGGRMVEQQQAGTMRESVGTGGVGARAPATDLRRENSDMI